MKPLAELDAHTIDVAVVPLDEIPARFDARVLYEDDLRLALRDGHPFLKAPTLEASVRGAVSWYEPDRATPEVLLGVAPRFPPVFGFPRTCIID